MRPIRRLVIGLGILVGLTLVVSACGGGDEAEEAENGSGAGEVDTGGEGGAYTLNQVVPPTMEMTSASITSGSLLPTTITCEGEDTSPQLTWTEAPEGTQSFAIIFDDHDAEEGDFAHWVLYSIPAAVTELQEGSLTGTGAREGINDYEKVGYNGPCPSPITTGFTVPTGASLPHEYTFTVYALDTKIDLPPGANKFTLLREIDGHILATGELTRRYVTKRRGDPTQ